MNVRWHALSEKRDTAVKFVIAQSSAFIKRKYFGEVKGRLRTQRRNREVKKEAALARPAMSS